MLLTLAFSLFAAATAQLDLNLPPAPSYPMTCPAMLGPLSLKDRPANPAVPNLMRSQTDITEGVAKGDPWIILEAQEACIYAPADGAWRLTLASSKNPGLGQTRFRQWQGGSVDPANLAGLSGTQGPAADAKGRLHGLFVIKRDADGGVLALADYPASQADSVQMALKAAAAANPAP